MENCQCLWGEHINQVRDLCGGKGADVVVEATGFPEVWENAVNMVRPGGTVLAFGGTKAGTSITLDCQKFHYEEITLKAVYHHTPYHVQLALKLLSNGQDRRQSVHHRALSFRKSH